MHIDTDSNKIDLKNIFALLGVVGVVVSVLTISVLSLRQNLDSRSQAEEINLSAKTDLGIPNGKDIKDKKISDGFQDRVGNYSARVSIRNFVNQPASFVVLHTSFGDSSPVTIPAGTLGTVSVTCNSLGEYSDFTISGWYGTIEARAEYPNGGGHGLTLCGNGIVAGYATLQWPFPTPTSVGPPTPTPTLYYHPPPTPTRIPTICSPPPDCFPTNACHDYCTLGCDTYCGQLHCCEN